MQFLAAHTSCYRQAGATLCKCRWGAAWGGSLPPPPPPCSFASAFGERLRFLRTASVSLCSRWRWVPLVPWHPPSAPKPPALWMNMAG